MYFVGCQEEEEEKEEEEMEEEEEVAGLATILGTSVRMRGQPWQQ